jgi:hypothetical protein
MVEGEGEAGAREANSKRGLGGAADVQAQAGWMAGCSLVSPSGDGQEARWPRLWCHNRRGDEGKRRQQP